ncbi:hypothetical protein, partial [Burkholderia anthina]|uniref:hypothetical protein n=1 Tax=Burkholderia anthina TaxID=179879 RepID=UPI001EF05E12
MLEIDVSPWCVCRVWPIHALGRHLKAESPPHRRHAFPVTQMQKPPPVRAGVLGLGSLTITYFHTGIRTIIGVESFHGPVRDG